MVVIRQPKTFHFYFHWPKNVDEKLRHEIEFIIKNNKFLAQNKVENDIDQLLSRYKHGHDEHGK